MAAYFRYADRAAQEPTGDQRKGAREVNHDGAAAEVLSGDGDAGTHCAQLREIE